MKRKASIALRYEKGYKAPIVSAIGFGEIAERIIEEAEKNAVPIVENEELVKQLSVLPLNSSIPPDLYEACAAIISYVYSINNSIKTDE